MAGILFMINKHVQELKNIDLWLHTGAITYDEAKARAKPHLEALNLKAAEIARRLHTRPKRFCFHHFVR
jgi:hypothetical protein